MSYPVAIITYNRPYHTKRTIEALAANTLAKQTDVFIFADFPSKKEHEQSVQELRAYIDTVESLGYFKSTTIIKAEENEHVNKATIKAGNMILKDHEAFIGLEDDIETHPYFLEYMNDTLNFYKNDQSIMAVAGYAHQTSFKWALRLAGYKKDLLLSYAFHSYGWGIWKDRWETLDWEMKDHKEYSKSLASKFKANIYSWDHLLALKKEIKKPENRLWDIRLSYNMFLQKKSCIWPRYSYTSNIGFDGSGFHSWNFSPIFFQNSFKKTKDKITLDPNLKLSFKVCFWVTVCISTKWAIAFTELLLRKIVGSVWNLITLKFIFKRRKA